MKNWQRDDDAAEADLLRVLLLDPESDLDRSLQESYFVGGPAPYEEALLIAAERLIESENQEAAQLAAKRLHAASLATATRLRRLLSDAGYGELVEHADPYLSSGWVTRDEADADRAEAELLNALARLAPRMEISSTQRRRLDELVDLMHTSGFHDARADDAIGGVLKDTMRMRTALEAAGVLGGLDLGVVATQAGQLSEEIAAADNGQLAVQLMLTDGGRRLSVADWTRVEDPKWLAQSLSCAVTSPYPWIGGLAIRCLRTSPKPTRLEAIECLDAIQREGGGRHSAVGAALAATMLREDSEP